MSKRFQSKYRSYSAVSLVLFANTSQSANCVILSVDIVAIFPDQQGNVINTLPSCLAKALLS